MIEGMTGFGRATTGKGVYRWTVELRSVNHRFFDFSARLPNQFSAWESDIQKLIQPKLKRGRVMFSATLSNGKSLSEKLVLDESKLGFYVRTFRKIAKRHHLSDHLELRDLITMPNLFTVERQDNPTRHWHFLKTAVTQALTQMLRMRQVEGKALARDLIKRVRLVERAVSKIEKTAKESRTHLSKQFQEKVNKISEKVKLDPERLAREVAILAERADITEEIVRARHHIASLLKSLQGTGEAGKKLDFMLQEMNREVNTIASKAQNFPIASEVVSIKSELEKIREQVQNIV
ncbi:MAG: YicC family protein [Candidatus Omnitrophica bacterium CG11_big_fil_rev_8_21_14_0_20_45_26]|uniref:YicC family protein n=1 Tax=Candidatus Abzuiibacterium crystallinum TaxID=1974748 RepID=A0A2H0LQV9_9BACT|nr:MAG: YicC family protein [Candidatus Omnitrophica bacterium CG11_big_fil_rev_8_21_14_0_20_45_26]PIW65680.1 MAG: YicC family protein [Candidatus Omnitrophica bacterium CG12_big_fil_rev_8_21_14_0_65_45_16]